MRTYFHSLYQRFFEIYYLKTKRFILLCLAAH